MTLTIGKKFFALLAATATIGVATVAVAAWSTTGTGNAAAKASTAAVLTLGDASASATGDLYPGGSGALRLKLSNSNAFPVRITSVSLQSGGTVTSSSAACNTGGHAVTLVAQVNLSLDLPAGATDEVFTLPGAVAMGASAVDACQGVTFTVPVDVVATTSA